MGSEEPWPLQGGISSGTGWLWLWLGTGAARWKGLPRLRYNVVGKLQKNPFPTSWSHLSDKGKLGIQAAVAVLSTTRFLPSDLCVPAV